MKNETTNIVIIDDTLNAKHIIVRELKYRYKNVLLLGSVREGIEYLENNLEKRNIVLLDFQFSTREPTGEFVLRKIREKTKLIPVILMTVNTGVINNEKYISLINDHIFAIIDNKNDYNLVLKTVLEAEQSFGLDNAIEKWIERHSKGQKNKSVYIRADGKSYSLNDIQKEIQMQTKVGREFSRRLMQLTIDLLMRNKESLND